MSSPNDMFTTKQTASKTMEQKEVFASVCYESEEEPYSFPDQAVPDPLEQNKDFFSNEQQTLRNS